MRKKILMSLMVLFICMPLSKANEDKQPEELGNVHWLRKMNEAVAFSKQKGKPIFILFQEVPGCATCRNYGNNVLSHPLIVEAIETLFIPLAIYNNKRGDDAKVLSYYGEPSWNNPVVRIVDTDKKDIISRLSGNYSSLGIVEAMLQALTLRGLAAPSYLELLAEELRAEVRGTETATFSMYCFWTGEGTYGQLDGVVATDPGFMDGREVVTIEYDPALISFEELAEKGKAARCASKAYVADSEQKAAAKKIFGAAGVAQKSQFRQDREPKYYLSKTLYRYVPMTPTQAARANSLIGKRQTPDSILSPRQVKLVQQIKKQPHLKWPDAIGVDIQKGWDKIEELRSQP